MKHSLYPFSAVLRALRKEANQSPEEAAHLTGYPKYLQRQMRPGDALLVHGTLPPAHVRIKPWYRSRRLRKRVADR